MQLHCATCGKMNKVVQYERDDPILCCGHKLTLHDDLSDDIFMILRGEVYRIMREYDLSYKHASHVFWSEGYCR